MSLFDSFNTPSKRKAQVKEQYQPSFPLEYDSVYGPYKPITSLEESLHRNFINILLTSPGEWPMNPDLGVGLKRYLFENYGSPMISQLKPNIIKQVDRYLPNVKILDVTVEATDEQKNLGQVFITIKYLILGSYYIGERYSLDNQHRVQTTVRDERRITESVDSSLSSGLASDIRHL